MYMKKELVYKRLNIAIKVYESQIKSTNSELVFWLKFRLNKKSDISKYLDFYQTHAI